jgi:hypothetical protein
MEAAAMLWLLWTFDRRATPTEFLVVLESLEAITGVARAKVTQVAPGVCQQLPGAGPDEFCATLACPGPGRFRLSVEALSHGTRSNTIELRVRDAACLEVDGAGALALPPTAQPLVPAALPCRSTVPVATPPPVETVVPAPQTETVAIPRPRTTAPARPSNPLVVAMRPHAPGTRAPRTGVAPPPVTPSLTPPPLSVTTPSGAPTTVVTPVPPVPAPGVACP